MTEPTPAGRLPKRCECGGKMVYVRSLGRIFSHCDTCTPVVSVPTPAGDVGREGSTAAVEEVGGSAGRVDLAAFDGHTPGPWEAGRPDMATIVDGWDSKWVYGPDRDGKAVYLAVASGQDVEDWDEVMANARLIAAAPTLLAEVRALREERDALRKGLVEMAALQDHTRQLGEEANAAHLRTLAQIAPMRRALLIAGQMVDEINGVDLHEAAREEYVARTGDTDYADGEPSEDDYASAFIKACEPTAPHPPAHPNPAGTTEKR